MYPKNAASPERIAIGAVVQISDGAVQTSGCTVRVIPSGGAEGDGGGTTAYSTDGIVLYTPTQAETNYASFILIAKKAGCIPASVTVVPTASATAGQVDVGMIGGSSQSLTDLKDLADTGYDPSTHKVQGVVLADTATNLTNAPTAGDLTATMKSSVTAAVPTAAQIKTAIEAAGSSLAQILEDTGTTLNTHLTDIKGATFAGATDSLEAIRNQGDSAWATATSVTVSDKTGFSLAADQAVNVTKIAGAAVDATAAQIGVNVVNWKGSAAAAMTGDAYARLGTPAGASVSADVAAVKAETANILTDTGTTLEGHLTDIKGTGFLKDTTSLPQCLTATGFSTHSAADVKTAVEAAGSSIALIKAKTDNLPDSPAAVGSQMDLVNAPNATAVTAIQNGLSTFDSAADAVTLANGAHGGAAATITLSDYSDFQGTASGLTAAAVADAVWEEAVADHSGTSGSTAEKLNSAAAAGDPWSTALPGSYDLGTAGKIIGDNINATISSRSSHDAAAVKTAIEAAGSHLTLILEDTGTTLPASLTTISGKIDTVDDLLDTEVAAILADTNEIQTDLANGGRLDLLVDAIKAKTDTIPASPAAVGSEMTLTAAYDAAKTAAQAGDEMDLVNAPNATAITAIQNGLATPTNITAGTITTVTNLTNAPTSGDLTATMKASVTTAVPTTAQIKTAIEVAGSSLAAILEDTGTTIPALLPTDFATVTVTANKIDANASVELTTEDIEDLASGIAAELSDPWAAELPGEYASGTAGQIIGSSIAQILEDTGTTLPAAIQIGSAGHGENTWTYTLVDSSTGYPIAGARVWVTTDEDGENIVASGYTDGLGVVTFYLDTGTCYVWRSLSGYQFTNPDTETVP